MVESDEFEKTRELLGMNDGNPQAYRMRTLIVDSLADITDKEYLSEIYRLVTAMLCKQMFRDSRNDEAISNNRKHYDKESGG